MTLAAATVWMVTAMTGRPDAPDAAPKQLVLYESQTDMATCRAALTQARENLGHVPGSPDRGGILMDCVDNSTVGE
jgi:hypothetical protein